MSVKGIAGGAPTAVGNGVDCTGAGIIASTDRSGSCAWRADHHSAAATVATMAITNNDQRNARAIRASPLRASGAAAIVFSRPFHITPTHERLFGRTEPEGAGALQIVDRDGFGGVVRGRVVPSVPGHGALDGMVIRSVRVDQCAVSGGLCVVAEIGADGSVVFSVSGLPLDSRAGRCLARASTIPPLSVAATCGSVKVPLVSGQ